jgi:hypothetical protein
MQIQLLALVPDAPLPRRATAAMRAAVPPGHGVQEQCLPFVAAAALGVLVPAPFDFGLCRPEAVPGGARAFRPPRVADDAADPRWFYVRDRPLSRFVGNAYTFDPLPYTDDEGRLHALRRAHPGLSFFDREDQRHLFKLHLPWVLRTPTAVHSLFGAPINRPAPLALYTGLVETDWYAHPVNLALLRPPRAHDVHLRAGDTVAQVSFVAHAQRRVEVEVVERGSAAAQHLGDELLRWYAAHGQDRAAYRHQLRARQESAPGPVARERSG